MKAVARANWQDPEFRKRNAEAVRANWQDPEFRKRNAEAVRANWQDPEFRKRQAEAVRANWQDPEFRKRQAEAVRANWQDPEFRKRQAEATRASKEALLAWCPPELRDDYRLLVRHLGAADARDAIIHQMQHEQVVAVCPQCERRIDNPDCRSCTMPGCPLAKEDAA